MYNNLIYGSHTSGQIAFYEEITLPITSGWQTLVDTWQFETDQVFDLEIIFACTNPDTFWLDLVALNLGTGP
jgi:hypothetical protein